MKVTAITSQIALLALCGCSLLDLLQQKTTFAIASSDRAVSSAALRLCDQIYPLVAVDGRWEVSMDASRVDHDNVSVEDCDNSVTAMLNDGKRVLCPIGYLTRGYPRKILFHIKDAACQPQEVYGDSDVRNVS